MALQERDWMIPGDTPAEIERRDGSIWPPRRRLPSIAEIQFAVSHHYGMPMFEFMSDRRGNHISRPRMMAMYLCRKHTLKSYPAIGRAFAKDHTTVMHAIQRMPVLMEKHPEFKADYEAISAMLELIDE